MRQIFIKKTLCVLSTLLTFLFFQIIAVDPAYAGWQDNSDQLPGMEEDTTGDVLMTVGIAVGVTAVVGTVWYLIVKGKNKSKNQAEHKALSSPPVDSSSFNESLSQNHIDRLAGIVSSPAGQHMTKMAVHQTAVPDHEVHLRLRPAPVNEWAFQKSGRLSLSFHTTPALKMISGKTANPTILPSRF